MINLLEYEDIVDQNLMKEIKMWIDKKEAKTNILPWEKMDTIETLRKHLIDLEKEGKISIYKNNFKALNIASNEVDGAIQELAQFVTGGMKEEEEKIMVQNILLAIIKNEKHNQKYFYIIAQKEACVIVCCFYFEKLENVTLMKTKAYFSAFEILNTT